MARVTGVGGISSKSDDPKTLSECYARVLGLKIEEWGGVVFQPGAAAAPQMVWSPFAADSDYFATSPRDFMINLAVDDLDDMITQLAAHGVAIIGRNDGDPSGRFAWFLDPANLKIELWEPKK